MPFLRWNSSFNPQTEQDCSLVKQDLDQFIAARDKLLGLDKWLSCGAGFDLLVGFAGGLVPAIVVTFVLFKYYHDNNRPKLVEDYQKKLNKLMETYHWMQESHTAALTKVPLFMDVVEAIAPFVMSDELMPWEFNQSRMSDFSERYLKVLSAPPHNRDIVVVREPGLLESFAAPAVANRNAALSHSQLDRKKTGMFSQTMAETCRFMYGYQRPRTNNEENIAPNADVEVGVANVLRYFRT